MANNWRLMCNAADLSVDEAEVTVTFPDQRSHRVTVADVGDEFLLALDDGQHGPHRVADRGPVPGVHVVADEREPPQVGREALGVRIVGARHVPCLQKIIWAAVSAAV